MAKRFTGIGVVAVLTAIGGFVALGACGGDSDAVDGDCTTLPTCCTQLSDASNKTLCEQIVMTADPTSCGEAQADFETDSLCKVSSGGGGGGGTGCAGLMTCCGTLSGEDATLCADEVTASAGSDSECSVYLTSYPTCASVGTGTGTGGTGCAGLSSCCATLPSEEQAGCQEVASEGIATTCSEELSVLCPGTGTGTGTGTGGTGCSGLSSCCATLPSEEQAGCQEVVSEGIATTCTEEESVLCPGTGTGTGTGTGGCATLNACCPSLTATYQSDCTAEVAAGSDTACSEFVTELQELDMCN
jgi:hypothetical protein